ncbi:MAG TPA: ABC-2 transporter permease, partial [Planctomycetota bacterium]|nr:ABC-2 transporter permease [Planctomycetota bacterium]
MSIRPRAVGAVFRRNFSAYFGSPTGYVFITIFIVAGAYLAFSTAGFFAVNLADLSSLNALFHWLLILFIPAITMGAWADEQRLGTDELLFTLPLRDVEIVLGKFLAAAGVYTVALLFALSHAFVLAWLGDPDWGLITANYVGYWVMGSTLITVGLVASALTSHVTVAF